MKDAQQYLKESNDALEAFHDSAGGAWLSTAQICALQAIAAALIDLNKPIDLQISFDLEEETNENK